MIPGSCVHEILERYGVRSVVDPLMGVPVHLGYLKAHGLAVHGCDAFAWTVCVGNGIVVNDSVILRDEDVASIVEMVPGRVYELDAFGAWEGTLFTQEQCRYLDFWLENVRALRSDAHAGLAVLGLWRVFCYWLQKTAMPDASEDIDPSELAWQYLRRIPPWLASNGLHNTVRQADPIAFVEATVADALLLDAHAEWSHSDARVWMWEAWWRGNPHFTPDPPSHDTIARILGAAGAYRIVVALATERERPALEERMRACGRTVERIAAGAGEIYLVGTR